MNEDKWTHSKRPVGAPSSTLTNLNEMDKSLEIHKISKLIHTVIDNMNI